LLLAIGALVSLATQADYARDSYRDTRLLGRGNAGVADVTGAAAAFYNPAALAAHRSISFMPVDFSLGANKNVGTSFSEISTLNSSDQTLGEKFAPFLGKPMALQGTFFPHVLLPGFVAGFYDYADTNIEYNDPVFPRLDLQVRNDWGLVFGGGANVSRNIQLGASIRYMKRKSIDQILNMASVFNMTGSYLTEIMEDGEAWGFNVGARAYQERGNSWMAFGLVVEDVGATKFKNSDRGPLPERQAEKINAGFGYGLRFKGSELKLLFDIKELADDKKSYTKRIFTGAELAIPYLTLRTGLFQGYWTAGFSTSLIPFFDIDLTTYGEELSSAAGLRESRYWLLGIRTGLDMTEGPKKKQRFTLDHL
jgi:hypothetical protein